MLARDVHTSTRRLSQVGKTASGASGDAFFLERRGMPDMNRSKLETSLAELNGVLTARTDAATRDRISLRGAVCSYLAAERSRGTSVADFSRKLTGMLRETEGGNLEAAELLTQQLVGSCVKFHPSVLLQ